MRQVLLASLMVLGLYGATDAGMSLATELGYQHGHRWLGPLVNGMNSAAVAVGCLFSNLYLASPLSFAHLFGLGSLSYCLILALILLGTLSLNDSLLLALVALGAAVAGLGCSMVFMAQDLYIAGCAELDPRRSAMSSFAVSYGIVQCAGLLGSFLTRFLVQPLGQTSYLLLLVGLALMMAMLFQALPAVPRVCPSRPALTHMLRQTGHPGFLQVLPMVVAGGLVMSTIFGGLSLFAYEVLKDDPDPASVNARTGLVFTLLGTGELAGGLLLRAIQRLLPPGTAAFLVFVAWGLSLVLTALSVQGGSFPLLLGAGLCWGVTDCSAQAVTSALIADRLP